MFPNNCYSRKHLLHMGRNLDQPFIAGYVSSASIMIPRKVVEVVGELDRRLSYHVDADYCKRIADAGYSCYYLPSATVIHFDHKGGTMVSLRRRFRSLVEFHLGSYIFYRKHIQQSPWTPMQIIVVVGIFFRFLLSVMAQSFAELRNITIALAGENVGLRRQEATRMTGDLPIWRAAPLPAPAAKPTADC
jgi:GT2 family glycosyltransferase